MHVYTIFYAELWKINVTASQNCMFLRNFKCNFLIKAQKFFVDILQTFFIDSPKI